MGVIKKIGAFGGRLIASTGGYSEDSARFGAAVARAKWKRQISGRDTKNYVEQVAAYVQAVLAPLTRQYATAGYASTLCAKARPGETPVWFCWWQGEAHMPDTVRLCYARAKSMAPDPAAVHLITLKNVRDYVDFPPVIEEKYYARTLHLQALTDVLRATLLCAYGGVWVDPYLYIARPLADALPTGAFFSPKLHYRVDSSPSQGLWNSKLLYVPANPVSMNYVREAFTLWWSENEGALDERLFDYFLLNAYRSLDAARAEIDAVEPNNIPVNALQVILNEPYSRARFAALETQCAFFDLSSDAPWRLRTDAGEETLFGFLYHREFGQSPENGDPEEDAFPE